MKLDEVKDILNAKVLCGEDRMDTEIKAAFGCDLMSDVLAFVEDQALLLTGLINSQVVRTAVMMDMKAIVFVRGKTPSDEMLELAKDAGIAILSTELTLYISSGKLYSSGLYN